MEKTLVIRGSQRALAKRLGVSQPAVSKMVKGGVVKVEPGGKILLEQTVEDWQTKVNVSQQRPFRWTGPKTEAYYRDMERYRIARARREVAEAALAELKLQKALGQVLDAEGSKESVSGRGAGH